MNKKNKKMKKNKGFSLVELIIVIAIMAILAGVLIPQFVRYIGRAGVSADIDQAQNIYNAVASLYADDQVSGTTTAGMAYDGAFHAVDGTVATALSMGTGAPTSRVHSGESFFYSIAADGTDIKVGVGASATAVTEIVPTVTASSDWDK